MKPILFQLAPATPESFVTAVVVAMVATLLAGGLSAHFARRRGGDVLTALGSLLPAVIVIGAFLFFWRTNTIRIYTYGVLLLIGFTVAWISAVRDAPRFGWKSEPVTDIAMLGLALGIFLARGAYVMLNRGEYAGADWKQPLKLWEGGLTFHGAVVGAVIAAVSYTHFNRIPFWKMTDFLAPYMSLGYAVGRLGCFLNGCCYGVPTTWPVGMKFLLATSGSALTQFPVAVQHTPSGEVWSRDPLHPTQLYAAALGFLVYFILRRLRIRFHNFDGRHGRLLACFFLSFGAERFITEIARRGATARPFLGPLTEGQVASLGLITLGLIVWKWRTSLPPEPVPEPEESDQGPTNRKKRKPRRNLQLL